MPLAQDTGIISSAQCHWIDTLVLNEGVDFNKIGEKFRGLLAKTLTINLIRGHGLWLQSGS
jgi:hypothetical protein